MRWNLRMRTGLLVYISPTVMRNTLPVPALLLAVSALFLLSACGGSETPTRTPTLTPPLLSVQEHMQRGDAFLENKQPGAALREYRNAVRVDSQYAPARVGLGKSHAMRSEFELALDEYRRAIRIDPGLAEAYFERGKIYGTQAKLTPAMRDFDKSIELDPNNAAAYNSRGFALIAQGMTDEALGDFDKAIEIDPELAHAYANRAFTYAALGRDADAESDAQKAIELGLNRNEVMEQLEKMRSTGQAP